MPGRESGQKLKAHESSARSWASLRRHSWTALSRAPARLEDADTAGGGLTLSGHGSGSEPVSLRFPEPVPGTQREPVPLRFLPGFRVPAEARVVLHGGVSTCYNTRVVTTSENREPTSGNRAVDDMKGPLGQVDQTAPRGLFRAVSREWAVRPARPC